MQRLLYLVPLLICLLGSPVLADEIVTGQETSENQMPAMSEFTRSGGTSFGTGSGCAVGEYCTAGKQGPGGTYSTIFDLEDAMTINQINRGFDLDYGMGVDSHSSNTTVPTCAGDTLAVFDCKDIFRLTVSLFDENSALQHKFEHEVELTFSGLQTFSYSQTVPENSYAGLTGEFEMFGIDAGFPSGFFGPQFSNPTLTTTYDLVTLIEIDVLNVLQQTNILTDNSVQIVEVNLAPPPDSEMEDMEAQVEQEMSPPSNETMGGTTGPPPPPEQSDFQPPPQEQQQQEEVQAEVEQEIEAEVEAESDVEPEPETSPEPESSSSSEEAEPEPEPEAESDSQKVLVKKAVKEKIAKRIMKRMGDKGRYDVNNQLKTLVVMQVLGNSKSFFETTKKLSDIVGFFNADTVPDATISGNNFAQYILFGGSSAKHEAMVNSQYR